VGNVNGAMKGGSHDCGVNEGAPRRIPGALRQRLPDAEGPPGRRIDQDRVRPGIGQLRDLRLGIAASPIIARDRSRRSRRSRPQVTVAPGTQKARPFTSFMVPPHLHINASSGHVDLSAASHGHRRSRRRPPHCRFRRVCLHPSMVAALRAEQAWFSRFLIVPDH
jgi:hypothetical protein